MKKSALLVLTISLAMILGADAFAGDGGSSSNTFQLRRHEFAIGGSFLPGSYMISHIYGNYFFYKNEIVSRTNAWWASYTYNFTKVFALGISLTYDGLHQKWDGGCIYEDDMINLITPMITARFTWLNRPLVRLYSSAGAGLLICKEADFVPYCKFAFQVTPIGISVGKKLYGYAELGAGTQYAIGCAGIGYRF